MNFVWDLSSSGLLSSQHFSLALNSSQNGWLGKKWAKAKPGYKIQIVSNYRKVGLVLFLEVKAQNPIFLIKYE